MNRRNQILAIVLAAQLVVTAIVFWPRGAASGQAGQSLFSGVEASAIVKVKLTDASGKSIEMARGSEGWVLPAAGDYPCLSDSVEALAGKIATLKTGTTVTTTPGSHKRLKVAEDDFERKVEFQLADGTSHVLYIGSSPSYGASHIRADNRDEVYLSSGISSGDAGVLPTAWVDRTYFSVTQDQVMAMTLENANGRFEFEKNAEGAWTMKGLSSDETLDETKVTSLLSRASSVVLTAPLGKEDKPEYGLSEPTATVTLVTHTEEGGDQTHTLRVGAKNADDASYVVSSSDSPYYVRVSEYAVKDFVETTRNGFLKIPPTPTAAPSATPTS